MYSKLQGPDMICFCRCDLQAAAKPETPIVSPTTDGEKRKKKKKKSALAD